MSKRLIFHVDVNSAFLSWESARRVQMGEPDLRNIASCVGGDPKKRTGVVLAKSIPAKKYGIVTGEPMAMALRKCPALVSVKPDFALYEKCSKAFKEICASYAPVMESFSIDEVFMDMSGTSLIYPDPVATAVEIKNKIRDKLGFTVNIGISCNKLLAKTASDFEKPDKVHTLFSEEIPQKMWPLGVENLLFCGKSSVERLNKAGIRTIGELACAREEEIKRILGEKNGHQMYEYANGRDDSPVRQAQEEAKGYSVETTFEEDIVSMEQALPILLSQCDIVATRLRADKKRCACVAVSYRTLDFQNKSHQCTLENATDVTDDIYKNIKKLFNEAWKGQPLRLIGVAVSGITTEAYEQMSLFDSVSEREKKKEVDQTIDALRKKFGNNVISRASTMNTSERIGRKYKAKGESKDKGI